MDREAIRALNRERVRQHRAQRAIVEDVLEHRFLRRFNKQPTEANSNTSTHSQPNESTDDDTGSEVSRAENDGNQETMDSDDVGLKANIEEVNVQAGPGFDFEEFVSKLKTSPASSVKSNGSWKNYAEQQTIMTPVMTPAVDIVRKRVYDTTNIPQESILPDIATATGANVLQLIFEGIQKLTYEQQQLTETVNRMSMALDNITATGPQQQKREPFEKKYKLQLPFLTRQDFLVFDQNLAKDETFRAAFVFSIIQKYDTKKTITKNITAVLRKYMTRDVALLYTAQKAVGGKALFKETALSACLLEVIDTLAEDKVLAPVPDNEYLASLGSVLSNAKDWGVPRHERRAPKRKRN